MNVKFLTTILLSSVVSALTVLVLTERTGRNESESNALHGDKSVANTGLNVLRPHVGRHPKVNQRGTSDCDKPNGKQRSGVLRRDVRVCRSTSVSRLSVSNSHKIVHTFYVTRNRYKEGRSGSATAGLTDRRQIELIGGSPTVYISDPVNPQQGMIANAYVVEKSMDEDMLQKSNLELPEMSSVKTFADKGDTFSLNLATGTDATVMRWDGFIKCKRATTYTFLLNRGDLDDWDNGYSMRINNDLTGTGCGENAIDADLKVGWNRIEIVCQFKDKSPLTISFRPKGSLSDPRPIAPKDLFHDQKIDGVW